jgi:hypothetical protein
VVAGFVVAGFVVAGFVGPVLWVAGFVGAGFVGLDAKILRPYKQIIHFIQRSHKSFILSKDHTDHSFYPKIKQMFYFLPNLWLNASYNASNSLA